ncbi:MAG: hypothetical protein IKH44_13155 [Bacteroidales bacterium]|nr:hypothetical protein [Bacteroidales bacterium]
MNKNNRMCLYIQDNNHLDSQHRSFQSNHLCMSRYNYFHSLCFLYCTMQGLKAQLMRLQTVEEPFSWLP